MVLRRFSDLSAWRDYQTYHVLRSCEYDPTPGDTAPPSQGNLPPWLIIRIFVHKEVDGEERQIGREIEVVATREVWKDIRHINSVEAANQLEQAVDSANKGDWNAEPLRTMLSKGWVVVQEQIKAYEKDGTEIGGQVFL